MRNEKIRIYLDNCAYNRPYDNQSDITIRLESEAKLFIQEEIKDSRIDLVWSSVNSYENNDNPSPEKRERIAVWKDMAAEYCSLNESILKKALELQSYNLRAKDALHIAAAIYSQCRYFITTDRKILNKKIDGIAVVNPVTYLEEYSE
jgi:predicted nucleic acid-binding protein